MEKLAFTLPGGTTINSPVTNSNLSTTGGLISGFLNIAFMIAGLLLLFWLVWGVFQYIFAGGNKENLARAKARITWALIGFIVVVLAFFCEWLYQGFSPAN